MKKGIIIAAVSIVSAAAIYGGYAFFVKVRSAYIISGYNAAVKQTRDMAEKEGQVVITIDGKRTILVPQK